MKEKNAQRLCTALDHLQPPWVRRHRRANIETLYDSLHWTEGQKRHLYRRHMEYLGRMRLHMAGLGTQTPADIRNTVMVRGEEHVKAALAKERGLLVVLGHTGTFYHVPFCLASRGFEVSVVANLRLLPGVGAYLRTVAERFNLHLVQVGDGAYDVARNVFRRKQIFVLAFDQTVRLDRSIWLRFFNAALPVDRGSAMLALRQRVPTLWASSYHNEAGRSCVEFTQAPRFGRDTPFNTPEAVLRYWVDTLERDVERHPEQWWSLSFTLLAHASVSSSPSVGQVPNM